MLNAKAINQCNGIGLHQQPFGKDYCPEREPGRGDERVPRNNPHYVGNYPGKKHNIHHIFGDRKSQTENGVLEHTNAHSLGQSKPALHIVDPGSISGIPIESFQTHQDSSLSAKSEVSPEYLQVCPQNNNQKNGPLLFKVLISPKIDPRMTLLRVVT